MPRRGDPIPLPGYTDGDTRISTKDPNYENACLTGITFGYKTVGSEQKISMLEMTFKNNQDPWIDVVLIVVLVVVACCVLICASLFARAKCCKDDPDAVTSLEGAEMQPTVNAMPVDGQTNIAPKEEGA